MSPVKTRSFFQRAVALAILISFNVGIIRPGYAAHFEEISEQRNLSVSELKIPQSLGNLETFQAAASNESVIIIQDAHAVGDAQKSILGLTDYFSQAGVRLFALEGASGELDTVFFRNFPDPARLRKVFEAYLQSGELSGAAAGAVLNKNRASYYGAEDQLLYEEGVALFLKALDSSDSWQKEISGLNGKMETLKKEIYSPQLLELDQKIKNFESHEHAAEAFQYFLSKQEDEKIDLTPYPHISALFQQMSSSTQSSEIKNQLISFTEKLRREQLNQDEITELNKKLQDYRTEICSVPEYAAYLSKTAAAHDWSVPSVITRLARTADTLSGVRGDIFNQEFNGFIRELKERFYETQDARALDQLQEIKTRLENFAALQLTRKDWEVLKEEASETQSTGKNFQGKLTEMARSLTDLKARMMESAFSRFYSNAETREKSLNQNLLNLMKKKKSETAVLVAGGFHAQGMMELLRKEGVSYALVSPAIQTLEKENHYQDYMRGNVSWKSYFQVQNERVNLYEAFTRAGRDRLVGKKDTANPALKRWRDQIIRGLAEEKNTAKARNYTRFIDEVAGIASDQDKEKIKKQWFSKVENFIHGLEKLQKENHYDAPHLYELLGQPIPAASILHTVAVGSFVNNSTFQGARFENRSAYKTQEELISQILKDWNGIREHGFFAFDMQKTLTARKSIATPEMTAQMVWLLEQGMPIVINSGNTQDEVLQQVIDPIKTILKEKEQQKLLTQITIYANSGTLKMTFDESMNSVFHPEYQEPLKLSRELEETLRSALKELAREKFFMTGDPSEINRLRGMYENDAKKAGGKITYNLSALETGQYQKEPGLVAFEHMSGEIEGPYIQRRGLTPSGASTALAITKFLPETRARIIEFLKTRIRETLGSEVLEGLMIASGGESTIDIISAKANKALALVDYVTSQSARAVDLKQAYYAGDEITMNVHGETTGAEGDHPGNDSIVFTYPYADDKFKEIKGIAVSPEAPVGFDSKTADHIYYVGSEQQGMQHFFSALQGAVGSRAEARADKSLDYAALKGLEHVKNSTIISLQMEMGYSAGFLEAVEENVNKKTADQVSQATLTGGLGALMHDLFPSWKANGLDIIGIHPIWEEIKKKPYPEGPLHLGQYQRQVMEAEMKKRGETPIEYTVDLAWDEDYKRYAQENEKARAAYGRQIHVRALKEYTSQYGAPNYHLDAYYLIDEIKPDVEENRHRVFDTVYSDDHPAWRDYHLAVYARASEALIKLLKNQGVIKKNTVEIHNEVFASMPKMEADPNRTLVHINHSAYLPTIYSPSVKSYGLLGFPLWMRQYIVKDGNAISIVDFAGLNYDLLTGVAIDEHYWVLRRNIFRNSGARLDHYNDGKIRSTNGVLTEHWQSLPLQQQIEHFRVQLGLPEKVDSADFYEALAGKETFRKLFIARQEFIKAAEAANFLGWMADIQKQPGWLDELLRETGKTRNYLNAFFKAVEKAAQSNDPEAWGKIQNKYASLRDLLLSHPMVSNVRRQVPYKGPEKWLEVLYGLRDSPAKLAAFKNTKIRVVIGGRTFSGDADRDFQSMKQIIKDLGLENHFAFIEDYNVFDAAIMFRAMAGVVMLSDEFLEASATSMMKGVVNGAALIGVWGGAMPELFKILDENGDEVNIFAKKTPHNLVVKNLRNKKWKLVNGYMVRYSPEKSLQAGGGRRPDAEALSESLFWLDAQYADPAKRQELLWQSVSGTPKVDMREGQARAHMQLMEKLLSEKEQIQQMVFEGMIFRPEDFDKILRDEAARFVWRRNETSLFKTGENSPPGLFGLLNMFREISTYGNGDERGKDAAEAVKYHALRGDFFQFMLHELKEVPPSLKPLADEIRRLAAEADPIPEALRRIQQDPEKEDEYLVGLTRLTNLNIRAMELIEKFGMWIAQNSFEVYFNDQNSSATESLNQNIFKNHFIRKYLARYLDARSDVISFETEDILIRAYGIISQGKPFIFGVSLGSPTNQRRQGAPKAYTPIKSTAPMRKFMEDIIPHYAQSVQQRQPVIYQMVNEKSGAKYGFYNLTDAEPGISIGVPEPENVQLLQLVRQDNPGARLLTAKKTESFNTQALSDFLADLQQKSINSNGEFEQGLIDEQLAGLVSTDAETARGQFKRYLPVMMELIAGLSPASLDSIKDWDPMVYAALKKMVFENQRIFKEGKIAFHLTNRPQQTIVFSRSINGGENGNNIIFPLQFSESPKNQSDGRIWSRVFELNPINLIPTNEYEVRNLLTGITYQTVRTGTELMDGWNIGIPVEDRYERGEKVQHGWGIDAYQIRSVTPRFDLISANRNAPDITVSNLFLAVNLLDLGAQYDNASATVETHGGLRNLGELLPAIKRAGFGTIYPYGGFFETGQISRGLHAVETDSIHWIGDTAGGSLPRVLVSVKDYKTKRVGNLRDNHGNSFSVNNLIDLDPRHASLGGVGPNDTEPLLEQNITTMTKNGMSAVFDFIFWRSPESVNESNYKQYFYRELNEEDSQDWQEARTDKERLDVMKNLSRSGGHFVVRLNEGGRERLILVQHMFNEPGRDQAVRNPFNPDVIAKSKEEIEKAIDRGARGIRIDLAHKLLNSELKPMIEKWQTEGWQTDSSGAYRADYEPLKDLIEHGKKYAKDKEKKKEKDEKKDREFYVIAEAYMNYHHDELRRLGVDAVYYENVHKDFIQLAEGSGEIKARNLADALQAAFENKDLFTFPSNFDIKDLKGTQGSREALLLAMVILARLGVPVMLDARELMDQHGQLIPIPGGEHRFPTSSEIQKRVDFDHYHWQFDQAPFVKMIREFLDLINGRKLTALKILDNENRDQFISLDLEFEQGEGSSAKKDHLLVLLNMKPSEDRIVWSQAVPGQAPVMEDLQTGERFQVSGDRVNGIVFPSNIQYRILAPGEEAPSVSKRSELRAAVASILNSLASGETRAESRKILSVPVAQVVPVLREAARDPKWVDLRQALLNSGAEEKIRTEHPDYSSRQEKMVLDLNEQTFASAEKYMSQHPGAKLNYAFAFSVDTLKPQSETFERILKYLDTVKAIQEAAKKYPGVKVESSIKILMSQAQLQDPAHEAFRKAVGQRSDVAKLMNVSVPETAGELSLFLGQNPNALAYGLSGDLLKELDAELLKRVVDSQLGLESQLPVTFILTNHLAQDDFRLDAESIRAIGEHHGSVVWNEDSRRFEITVDALNLVYQDYLASSYVASMA